MPHQDHTTIVWVYLAVAEADLFGELLNPEALFFGVEYQDTFLQVPKRTVRRRSLSTCAHTSVLKQGREPACCLHIMHTAALEYAYEYQHIMNTGCLRQRQSSTYLLIVFTVSHFSAIKDDHVFFLLEKG